MTTNYTILNRYGRVEETSTTQPTITRILEKDVEGDTGDYVVGLDDKFKNGGITRRNSSGTSTLRSYEYQTEYILYIQDVGGTFEPGYAVEQMFAGYTMDAVVTVSEHTDDHGFKIWDGYTGGYIIGLKDVGPTGGTGGPTGPGTSGDTGGYLGNTAGRLYVELDPTGISCDVHSIRQIIQPDGFRRACIDLEIVGLTQSDYSSILYSSAGETMDLTSTITNLEETYHTIVVNHQIYGTGGASSITSTTVYDTNGISFDINAVSGGTPDTSVSEFNTLYYNWLTTDDTFTSESEAIRDAYRADGTGLLDSVHKIRTLFETRNP